MRVAAIFATVLLGLSSHNAGASEPTCSAIVGLPRDQLAGCTCGPLVAKLPVAAPSGMKLVAACGENEENGSWYGGFYFTGRHVQSGTVKREENEWFGDSLWFDADTQLPYQAFSSEGQHLKFSDAAGANKRFRAPRPTQKTGCWSAKAKIEIQILQVLSGGTDESGSYARKYRVLSLGQYRPCAKNL